MSFFIGKSNGKPLMHITKGSYSEDSMKGRPLADTVFHSDLPYLEVLSINTLNYVNNGAYLSNAIIDQLLAGYSMIVVGRTANDPVNTYKMLVRTDYTHINFVAMHLRVTITHTIAFFPTPRIPSYLLKEEPEPKLSYTNRYLCMNPSYVPNLGNMVDIKLLILSANKNGFLPMVKTTNDILIDRKNFKVGGVDLSKRMFFHSQVINNKDMVIADGEFSYQIINSHSTPSGSVSINSSKALTEIKQDGRTIFTTAVNSLRFMFKSTYNYYFPKGWAGTGIHTRTLAYAGVMKSGDTFTALFDFTEDQDQIAPGLLYRPLTLYRFVPGKEYLLFYEEYWRWKFWAPSEQYLNTTSQFKLVCKSDGSLDVVFSILPDDSKSYIRTTLIQIIHFG